MIVQLCDSEYTHRGCVGVAGAMRGRARARLGLASVRLHPAYMDDSGVSDVFTGENRSLI